MVMMETLELYSVVVLVSSSRILIMYWRIAPFCDSFAGGSQESVSDVEVFCDVSDSGDPLGAIVAKII